MSRTILILLCLLPIGAQDVAKAIQLATEAGLKVMDEKPTPNQRFVIFLDPVTRNEVLRISRIWTKVLSEEYECPELFPISYLDQNEADERIGETAPRRAGESRIRPGYLALAYTVAQWWQVLVSSAIHPVVSNPDSCTT